MVELVISQMEILKITNRIDLKGKVVSDTVPQKK